MISVGTFVRIGNAERGRRSAMRGFSLMELMITIAIVGILSAIAYPSYRDYVLKSNRAVAKSKLLEIAARQESYFADNKVYSDDLSDLGYGGATVGVDDNYNIIAAGSADSIYTITSVSAPPNVDYTLIAVPQAGQAADEICSQIQVNSAGDRSASDPVCWE